MKSNVNIIKNIIITFSIILFVFVLFLSIEIVNETDKWIFFDINYKGMSNEISAYGTLIGGVLSFLSILFVLYNIYEVRGQLQNEQIDKLKDERDRNLNRLKLVSNILVATTNEILSQGEKIRAFYELEKSRPSDMHMILWNTNRHFTRLMNLDFEDMFTAFQLLFKDDPDWNKILLNLYNLNDFYGEAFKDLKAKHVKHIDWKVTTQKSIGVDMEDLLTMMTDLVDKYKAEMNDESYINQPWSNIANEYVFEHYSYLKSVAQNNAVPDYRLISDSLLYPFIEDAMILRKYVGFDDLGSAEITKLASKIRKRINEVEVYSIQYAENLEEQYLTYFNLENDSVKKYKDLKTKIDLVIKKNS